MGTIQGALFLFMFRYVFGGAIATGGEISYVDFLVPGFLVTTVLWTGMSAAAGVAEDSASGLYDRLRSLPIPRSAVMLGRSLADTALIGWGLLVTGVLGFAVGFRTHGSLGEVVFAVVLIVVYGFAVTLGVHLHRPGREERPGGAGHVDAGDPVLVHLQRQRADLVDARVDAAVRRQPADHGDDQRRRAA